MTDLYDEERFKLLIRLAKDSSFKLSNEKDRAISAKWIKFIDDTNDLNAKKVKKHVIQLLLLSLFGKCLVGPFEQPPDENKTLLEYKWKNLQPHNITKKVLKKQFDKQGQPDIHIELSGDLCEYVAIQEIPKFGHHFYYAYSPEKIKKWNNLDKDIIPKGLLNITVVSSPDTSVLADTIRSLKKRKQDALNDDDDENDLLGGNQCSLNEQPNTEILKEKEIQKLIKRGVIVPRELDVDYSNIQDGSAVHGPCIEKISISKNRQKIIEDKEIKHLQQENLECNMNKAREEIIAKIPGRIRERLSKKYLRSVEEEEDICAPDIFENKFNIKQQKGFVTGVKGVKTKSQSDVEKKKWNLEDFGLSQNEHFRPAHEVIDELIKEQQEEEIPPQSQPESVDEVVESFERSFHQRYQPAKQKLFGPEPLSCRRTELLKRLHCLKNQQPKKIVFDDVDISVEPEKLQFEKFVYTEFPDDPTDVTILYDMPTDDMFGSDQIADIQALPEPNAIYSVENASILLETEMKTDDIFGEDRILNPKYAFEEVEDECDSGCTSGSYHMGKKTKPDIKPISKTNIQHFHNEVLFDDTLIGDYTPSITDSMIYNIADQKLTKLLGGPQQASKLYGLWATKFQDYVDRMDKIEDQSNEEIKDDVQNISILHESKMEIDGVFGESILRSPEFERDKAKMQTDRLKNIKKRMANRKTINTLFDTNQDLLEPYVNEKFYEPPGLLDTSIEEQHQHSPLIKRTQIRPRSDPFASFEQRLDESLQYFKDGPSPGSKRKIFLDSDFLNRKIQNEQVPADDSILNSDEMIDWFQQSQFEKSEIISPAQTKQPISTKMSTRTPQPVFSHLYISKRSTPCGLPEVLTDAYMDQEISGFEDFLIAPEETPLVQSCSVLESDEMYTADMFGQDNILNPSKAEYQSPSRVALIKSIEQTKRFEKLLRKFKTKKGLPQEPYPEYKFPKLKSFIEHETDMFDIALPLKYSRFTDPAIIDKSYNKSGLPIPLLKSPLPPNKIDLFASFEKRMNKSLNPEERSFGHSFINKGELSGMFEEDMIAEPKYFNDLEYPQVNKYLLSDISGKKMQDGACKKYSEFNKFLLSNTSSERIEDISYPDNSTSANQQDETIWPESIQKRYENLLKSAQKYTLPENKDLSSFEPDISDEDSELYNDKIVRQLIKAEEQSEKLNRIRRKLRAMKDLQSEPKMKISECIPEEQICNITDPGFLYETANSSFYPKSYVLPSPYKTFDNSAYTPVTHNARHQSIKCQTPSKPLSLCDTWNQLENEEMPQYESPPAQAKEKNISFYANEMEQSQIKDEQMPSFDSPIPIGQSTMHPDIAVSSYGFNGKFDSNYSTKSCLANENDKSSCNYDSSLAHASIHNYMSPIECCPIDPQTDKMNRLKRRYAALKAFQGDSIGNILVDEVHEALMDETLPSAFYKTTPKLSIANGSLRRVLSSAEQIPDRKPKFIPKQLNLQNNIENEQMPQYESPPKAKPITFSLNNYLMEDDLDKEEMPEFQSSKTVLSLRTLSKTDISYSPKKESCEQYTPSVGNRSSGAYTPKLLKASSKYVPPLVNQSPEIFKPKASRSPLIQKPVPISPVLWGSFEKIPEFNISVSQLNESAIQDVTSPDFRDLPPTPPPMYKTPPRRNMLPLNVSPKTRIQMLMRQHPVYEVAQLPRNTGLSPAKFKLRERKYSFLEDEKFPSEDLISEEYQLGDLAYAYYIPTKEEELEWELAQQNKMKITPPVRSTKITPPRSRLADLNQYPEFLFENKEFKWLGDLIPYEQQIERNPSKYDPQTLERARVLESQNRKPRITEKPKPCNEKQYYSPNVADMKTNTSNTSVKRQKILKTKITLEPPKVSHLKTAKTTRIPELQPLTIRNGIQSNKSGVRINQCRNSVRSRLNVVRNQVKVNRNNC